MEVAKKFLDIDTMSIFIIKIIKYREEICITINEAARQTGVSARSLRYYEKKKLLIPERTKNGYRHYSQADVERIQMIKFFLGLGMGTNEIANLLNCPETGPVDQFQCAIEAIKLYESKLKEVQQQIEVLKGQEKQLLETLSCWKKIQGRSNQGIPLERKEA